MEIPLDQFEHYIGETILARGLSYFKNGRVDDLEEVAHGIHETTVKGTQDYNVQLTLEKGVLTDYLCTCPYDHGPVCKHVAAALFHLQQNELDIKQNTPGRDKKIRKKRRTKADEVNELLEKVSHDELKGFVRERTGMDRTFRDLFLSTYAHYGPGESKAHHKNLVRSILRSASGRDGYIDWSTARQVGMEVSQVLYGGQLHSDQGNGQSAFFISTAVLEAMTEALLYSDDSYGDIGGCIREACELLYQIAKEHEEGPVRESLFNYCLDAFEQNIFEDWDWHIDMLRIASSLTKTNAEYDRLMRLMDGHQSSEYTQETIQEIKYQLLFDRNGEKEANVYLEQHITNSRLRRVAILNAVAKEDFSKARHIALDGVELDEKDKPGLAIEWHDWLLKIAQATNDKKSIVKYARYLYLENFSSEQDYYGLLKQYVPKKEWTAYVNAIISDIDKRGRWGSKYLKAKIYIREAWWDRLMGLVRQNPSFETLSEYEQYLSKTYAKELSKMYEDAIIAYLEQNVGRKYYERACQYIKRIMKLGDHERANGLIAKFRREYPRRRALMEELDKV